MTRARAVRRRSGQRRPCPDALADRDLAVERRGPRRTSASRRRQGPGRAGGAGSRERGRGDQVVGRRAGEIAEHALEQAGVLLAGAHVVALEQRAGERGVRRDADEIEAGERAVSRRSAVARSGAVRDDLGEHRVVRRADLAAGADARVDADARPRGLAVDVHGAGRRQEAGGRVLGVEARLDGMAARHELLLSQRERLAGGDAQLLLDEVDAVHQLGHGMLDLQPRVHLEEEELARVAASR